MRKIESAALRLSPDLKDAQWAHLSRLMTGYALSPNARVATEIVRCLDRVAADTSDASVLLRETGRQLLDVWRKKALVQVSDNRDEQPERGGCPMTPLATGRHCSIAYCPECGSVHVQFETFWVRLPATVLGDVAHTFLEAEIGLKSLGPSKPVPRATTGSSKKSRH
jgi:hypothetical protein